MRNFILLSLMLAGCATAGALAAYHQALAQAQTLDSTLHLHDQPMQIRFLDSMTATATAHGPLTFAPHGTVRAQIPFRQSVDVPFDDSLTVHVDIEQAVPLALDLDYIARVPVSTYADIETMTRTDFAGIKAYRGLKVRARVPLDFGLDVPIRIRYRGDVLIRLSGPATMGLRHTLRVPVDEVLDARIALDQRISQTLSAPVELRMHPGPEITAILVTEATLHSTGRLHLEQ